VADLVLTQAMLAGHRDKLIKYELSERLCKSMKGSKYEVAIKREAIRTIKEERQSVTKEKGPKLHGLIHHSDRGIQYASNAYRKVLGKNQIRSF